MHNSYLDIRQQIAASPRWWDEYAVPRYCDFAPDELGDIYAGECVLLEIACQACGERFTVAMSLSALERFTRERAGRPGTLAEEITAGTIHYGDPPNIECCPAGPTMNCRDLRVVEYWRRDEVPMFRWQRNPSLEVALPDLKEV